MYGIEGQLRAHEFMNSWELMYYNSFSAKLLFFLIMQGFAFS